MNEFFSQRSHSLKNYILKTNTLLKTKFILLVCSETTHKYRWPTSQTRQPFVLEEVKTSLWGPVKSSLLDPSFRYHRQSTYTDAFGELKPFQIRICTQERSWLDPVGKRGDFYGESTYELDFVWPEIPSKMPRIPLTSTISWGILPILGKNEDQKQVTFKKETRIKARTSKNGSEKKKINPEIKM